MPLETKESWWDLWCELMAAPPEVPDLGHQKPPRRKRLTIRLPGGRRKILKGKRDGENVPSHRHFDLGDYGKFSTRLKRQKVRHDLREAINEAVEEIPSLQQPRHEIVFASYGEDASDTRNDARNREENKRCKRCMINQIGMLFVFALR
ncbi:MAG: hypothetical protein WC668_02275 [Patescibacteria group bacterium]|jgi:hypothetical protein